MGISYKRTLKIQNTILKNVYISKPGIILYKELTSYPTSKERSKWILVYIACFTQTEFFRQKSGDRGEVIPAKG